MVLHYAYRQILTYALILIVVYFWEFLPEKHPKSIGKAGNTTLGVPQPWPSQFFIIKVTYSCSDSWQACDNLVSGFHRPRRSRQISVSVSSSWGLEYVVGRNHDESIGRGSTDLLTCNRYRFLLKGLKTQHFKYQISLFVPCLTKWGRGTWIRHRLSVRPSVNLK